LVNQFGLAVDEMKKGNYNNGKMILENILKKDPDHADALYQLGICMSKMEFYPESIAVLNKCIKIKPDWCEAYVALGFSYSMNMDHELAYQASEKAVKLNPNDFDALNSFGMQLMFNKKIDQAITLYNLANLSKPDQPSLLFCLAEAYKEKKDFTNAKLWFERILELKEKTQYKKLAELSLIRLDKDRYKTNEPKMEVVAPFVSILEKFSSMDDDKIKEIVAELNIMNRGGFDLEDPKERHSMRTLEGDFSGLDLYCFLYAGLKHIDPEYHTSPDLEREYLIALEMIRNQKK
jgi:tetratricopeptide (TPR) repeat protein